ncbi:hypothetical protein Snov_4500 [Ancylobacter novellus DSM 506]|uniref:Uncharacterized protein n=1 Tax=Ancylobacter novellus (strain ATCC 8093 / DSM 506 / JCM 20403 / CCM 1077 / IAM 12100 / NBRC 12443 / NCIMB 10456) TaxID=639283 RepID=D7A3X9_ANCN5|nr:hypothetical protein [Ancylobacter novellus]ADH91756.1 hypothetical protein Snov_4500 [Ancylobacter novellus DSM 506]
MSKKLSPHDIHNATAGPIVAAIVKPTLKAGGSMTEVLVLLESVIAGTIVTVARMGGDEIVLDAVIDEVRDRSREMLAKMRLGNVEPGGSA